MQEFANAEIEFMIDKRHLVDVQRIFHKMEQRNLTAALRFYCQEDLQMPTQPRQIRKPLTMSLSSVKKYSDTMLSKMAEIHEFCNDNGFYDLSGRMIKDKNGDIRFNFGKHKGTLVLEVLKTEPQ